MTKSNTQSGFSLVELLLAMAIFSFGLLIVVAGSLTLMALYRSSNNQQSAQLNARTVLDRIVQSAHTSTSIVNGTGGNPICLEGADKMYYIGSADELVYEAGWDPTTSCATSQATGTIAAITDASTRIISLVGDPVAGTPGGGGSVVAGTKVASMRVSIRATNRSARLTADNKNCLPSDNSCAYVVLSTTASSRQQNFYQAP